MTTAPAPIHRARTPHGLTQILLAALVLLAAIAVVLLARHDWGGSTNGANTIQGSGVAATQARSLSAFTGIDLAGGNNVTVHVGGRQSVVVHADDNLIKLVTTEVESGTLVVGSSGSFSVRSPMSVDVTVPRLVKATLSGSGIVDVAGVQGGQFTARVPGSGVLTVAGTVERLDAGLSGSGDVRLQALTARDVKAEVSGSGRLEVRATHTLHASVPGSGAIFYSGNPGKVTQSVTGSGAVLAG